MSFGRLERSRGALPMSDINMTPLIDVMLVLLVIFMITAPLMVSKVKVDLPKTAGTASQKESAFISVVVDKAVHKASPTTGGRNKAQSEIDRKDLGAAAARDANAMVANTEEYDHENLKAAKAAAKKVKQQDHESIMARNRAIVDDVMME